MLNASPDPALRSRGWRAQDGVQFGAAFAQRRDGALDLFFALANVGADFLLMSEVKNDRPVHLLQGERREVLANGLRRVSGFERIHDGTQGHTGAGDVESAVARFDVFASLHVSSIEVSGNRRQLASRKPGFRIGFNTGQSGLIRRGRSDSAEPRINHISPNQKFRNQQVAGPIPAGGSVSF
jgi:hypothetical protein